MLFAGCGGVENGGGLPTLPGKSFGTYAGAFVSLHRPATFWPPLPRLKSLQRSFTMELLRKT